MEHANVQAGTHLLEVCWTRKDLETALKVSGRTIDRLVSLGQFPAPFHVGRSCRWRQGDILTFIKGQQTSRTPVV
jgi:predicted DNA-binding transcriptional regulator AlpA